MAGSSAGPGLVLLGFDSRVERVGLVWWLVGHAVGS
jgi:hypothetical protein